MGTFMDQRFQSPPENTNSKNALCSLHKVIRHTLSTINLRYIQPENSMQSFSVFLAIRKNEIATPEQRRIPHNM